MKQENNMVFFVVVPFEPNSRNLFPGDVIKLVAKPNAFDSETIEVFLKDDEFIGHVANSTDTNLLGAYSAGRLLDYVEDMGGAASAKIVLCKNSHEKAQIIIGGIEL